ncbi:hypothetical protein MSAN_00309100 [Mycena sanguinolenta]|uniref:F-box domain-containing protein n=1 Tax=Mycena sanguinolenta TaxID=230812 RepID=A0A8H7DK62_9AGAR|nr:hypothetical protein MSAN_00309100 [Mycena sanguinolenta]
MATYTASASITISTDRTLNEKCADARSGMSGSPVQSATPYLHILATELWLACWTLCSRRQLRRLSLVCQLFRDICLPLLFQCQTIEAGGVWSQVKKANWVEWLHRLHRTAVRLDVLATSPHVGSVHSWRFAACGIPQFSEHSEIQHFGLFISTYMRMLNTFSTTLSHYHNLRSLHLEAIVIDEPFRQALLDLSRLEDLALRSCDIAARSGFVLRLRSFAISGRTLPEPKLPREPLRIACPEALHTLHLDAPEETTPLFAGFSLEPFPQLSVLSLEYLSDLEIFLGFLAQCPRLEVLTINRVHPDLITSLPRYTVSSNTVPLLRKLAVRQEMLGLLAPNRPLAAVTIFSSPSNDWSEERTISTEDFMPIFNDLLKGSTPLLSLSVPKILPTLDLLTAITSFFPHLQELSIHLEQPKYFLNMSFRRPRPESPDTRCPVLHDDDAFDNIPEDDLSDAEENKPSSVALVRVPRQTEMSSSTNLHQIFHWIFTGAASLPREIEVLRLIWDEDSLVQPDFSLEEQHEVIKTLSYLYPHLRELGMGYPKSLWTQVKYLAGPDHLHSLYSLAQVCRIFSGPALDFLWARQETLMNILLCMPSDLWEVTVSGRRRSLRARRAIEPEDWTRFQEYAPRIKFLFLNDSRHGSDSDAWTPVFEMLSAALETQHLFPNLRTLSWTVRETLVLGVLATPAQLAFLPTLSKRCPLLTSVTLTTVPQLYVTCRPRSLMVCTMSLLQRLHVGSIDQSAFEHLSQLVTLKSLAIQHTPEFVPPAAADASRFPQLRDLSLGRVSHEFLTAFIQMNAFWSFKRLDIYMTSVPTATETTRLYALIGNKCDHAALTILTLDACHHSNPLPVDLLATGVVAFDALRPLLQFKALREICLVAPGGFSLDDAGIEVLAQAWSHVWSLRLPGSGYHGSPPRATLGGIRAFARHCPRLMFLATPFDASVVPDEGVLPNERSTAVRFLDVDDGVLVDPAAVAAYLFSMFPSLETIDTARDGGVAEDVQERADRLHGLWKEVERLHPTARALLDDASTGGVEIQNLEG